MNRIVKEVIKKEKDFSEFVTFGVLNYRGIWNFLASLYEEKSPSYNYLSSCIIKYVCRKAYCQELINISSNDKYHPTGVIVFTGQFYYDEHIGAYRPRNKNIKVSKCLKRYYNDKLSLDIYKKWNSIKSHLVRRNGFPISLINEFGESHVYFMRDTKEGYIKIGVSKHPNKRKKEIERSLGRKIELIKIIESGGFEMEQNLHYKFSDERVHGEWFKPKYVLEYIS